MSRLCLWGGLVVVLGALVGCTTTEMDSFELDSAKALLMYCVEAEPGRVGSTNASLARAYLETKQGLLVCQAVSDAIIRGNKGDSGA